MIVKDGMETVVGVIVLVIVYLLVGTLLSAGYIFLAGWNLSDFVFGILVAPIIMAVFSFLVLLVHANWSVAGKTGRLFCVGLCAYFFLPIIAHGVSLSLSALGYPSAARWLFAERYATLPVVLVCGISVTALCYVVPRLPKLPKLIDECWDWLG